MDQSCTQLCTVRIFVVRGPPSERVSSCVRGDHVSTDRLDVQCQLGALHLTRMTSQRCTLPMKMKEGSGRPEGDVTRHMFSDSLT
ncbi:predicted protein [Plenodomus lingam JN3]|uniref:Uncharacterized protein n=1 Tax=Leptosphaeria maculans (strain JN3 / isolate v23.1.3 / race Av1-4-5-6-7-8) TaxID=985895 RepID=E4ZFR1_LEPMJ|nr:predicted protein [Plenodomus lingam JN3]CBX90131.1 predicted protein [Plenodomus lingam JN3]